MNKIKIYFYTWILVCAGIHSAWGNNIDELRDSTRIIDIEEITIVASPKENVKLRLQPLSSTLFNGEQLQAHQIQSIKGISNLTPNLFIPDYGSSLTSAIYIRGIGSRINTPAVGLYVDNIPYIDKSAFDFNFMDIERIDVLRGPQGTLYGRNTMGGLIKIHTRSPFSKQGTEISMGAATGNNSGQISFVHRVRLSDRLALSAGGYFQETRGFFHNEERKQWADPKRASGAHMRIILLPTERLKFDFTASYDYTDEGGYAYRYLGTLAPLEEAYPKLKGHITNNRPNGYWRSLLNTGLNIEWKASQFTLNSVTGYQHVNDCMAIDQDFIAADIFTLKQQQRQHTISEEISIKNLPGQRWQHTTGIFGFYQWLDTDAPVTFYEDGLNMIQKAMDEGMSASPVKVTLTDKNIYIPGTFQTPSAGGALFHQSSFELFPQLTITAGLRLNYEHINIDYDTYAKIHGVMNGSMGGMNYENIPFSQEIAYNDSHRKDFTHLLPKLALTYRLNQNGSTVPNLLYASVSKGLRSGGYNIQMFSEIIQAGFRNNPSAGGTEDVNSLITYSPEYSWNYEIGSHLTLFNEKLQANIALFYIDTRDQQISKFTPNGLGRIMVNAGQGESYGAEMSINAQINRHLSLNANYGYTHATFSKYNGGISSDNQGIDYSDNYIPYVPQHTLNAGGNYTFFYPCSSLLRSITLRADYTGAGRIYWTEKNNTFQNFYDTVNAGILVKFKRFQVDIWTRNVLDKEYDTFYFESMNRGFAQSGKPRQFGMDIRVKL